jgi:hypothetical protein
MERYDYRENVKNDIKNYIRDNEIRWNEDSRKEVEERLNDDLWTVDSVTGNGSGSYTFNTWEAEEYLCHNIDLLQEARAEFGDERDPLEQGAEALDVTIRCYLLGQCIGKALDELEDEGWKPAEDEEEGDESEE